MAGASLLLPFMPLLPMQVLLVNLLTDLPETMIAGDRVDDEMVARPRRWELALVGRFMIVFGLLSSVFDYLTFGALRWVLRAGPVQFRTGWFVESVVSATLVVLVVRTRRPAISSRPSRALAIASLAAVAVAIALPATPLARPLGFGALPLRFLPILGAILVAYVLSAELVKKFFWRPRHAREAVVD
jgi:Mg2+-importing ATPase